MLEVCNAAERAKGLVEDITRVLVADRMSSAEAAKLGGRLVFANSQIFWRSGAMACHRRIQFWKPSAGSRGSLVLRIQQTSHPEERGAQRWAWASCAERYFCLIRSRTSSMTSGFMMSAWEGKSQGAVRVLVCGGTRAHASGMPERWPLARRWCPCPPLGVVVGRPLLFPFLKARRPSWERQIYLCLWRQRDSQCYIGG